MSHHAGLRASASAGGSAAGDLRTLLERRYGRWDAPDLVGVALRHLFPGRVAVVSSFGAEAAVLLALVADVDRATPVIFLDTGMHFPETLAYRDRLVARLGLADVRTVQPEAAALSSEDPSGTLHGRNPDRCCLIRKVRPLERALAGFDAWLSGRKRFQGGARRDLPAIEYAGGRYKLNPLASWSPRRLQAFALARGLPAHPLVARGFPSIGCACCTAPVDPAGGPRDGRWQGRAKTECGIHLAPGGPAASGDTGFRDT